MGHGSNSSAGLNPFGKVGSLGIRFSCVVVHPALPVPADFLTGGFMNSHMMGSILFPQKLRLSVGIDRQAKLGRFAAVVFEQGQREESSLDPVQSLRS